MVLITGATGIVGSHILVELLNSGKRVRILKRSTSSDQAIQQLLSYHKLKPSFEVFEGDITEPLSLAEAMEGCEQVYHCAALVSFRQGDRKNMFDANVSGTENVVNACLTNGIELCYISSTATMGDQLIEGMIREDSPWTSDRGRSDYALSKRFAEFEVMRGVQEGLKAIVVNPGVVLGPGNWGKSSTSVYLKGMNGMKLYPSGGNGFVDARDVAKISIELMNRKEYAKRTLLIGENATFKTLFTEIAQAHEKPTPSIKVPDAFVRMVVSVLEFFETVGLQPFSVTSESLMASINNKVYSSELARSMGFKFHSIAEAIGYTRAVFKLR